ncbi:hypothetical protein IIE_05334 [Bacillus cereus VD045]|nr:hypothetical protein IIE_05334 [Bacillus cereus VD045]HDR4351297.1 hypothetical protein [Bacillus cereus]HDR6958342.1 hypothetical protein [Bacillus cereus]
MDASNIKEDSYNKPVDSKELIPDEKLRQHINQWVLNREDANAPITKEDLLEIKDIYLDNKEIKDYRGLEYLQNLENLSLRNAQIYRRWNRKIQPRSNYYESRNGNYFSKNI